jgi:hypothetical protein
MNTTNCDNRHWDIWEALLALKATVLTEMGASRDNNAKLRPLADWLGRDLDLEAKYRGLVTEAERLIGERSQPAAEGVPANTLIASGGRPEMLLEEISKTAGKAGANDFRHAYLMREKGRGRNLTEVGHICYRNAEGVVLGVTFSSSKSRGSLSSTWFLNLKDKRFQEAVLLCQTGADTAEVVHLPRAFIERFGPRLSRDKKGEVKFNLARPNGRFRLDITKPTGWVDVDEYAEHEPLKRETMERYV